MRVSLEALPDECRPQPEGLVTEERTAEAADEALPSTRQSLPLVPAAAPPVHLSFTLSPCPTPSRGAEAEDTSAVEASFTSWFPLLSQCSYLLKERRRQVILL